MTRLIDAEILFEKVGNIKPNNKSEYELLGKFMNMITDSPTVERPHGEWLERYYKRFKYYCSNCGSGTDRKGKFCDTCGADMRKESKEK